MRIIGLVLIACALSSCAGPASSTSSPATPPPGSAAPPPTIDPDWVLRPAYTCSDGLRFPPEALTAPMGAEQGSDPAAAALRAEIAATPPEVGLPRGGWRRVVHDGDSVLFVGVGDGTPRWHQVGLLQTGSGWIVEVVGDCDLRIAMPDDRLRVADWWIDPAAPPIAPEATGIAVLVLERACASGQDATGRIAPPVITATPDVVSVLIAVRRLEGGQDCQGHPATPFTLELAEPLGGRALLDGGTIPPRQPIPVG